MNLKVMVMPWGDHFQFCKELFTYCFFKEPFISSSQILVYIVFDLEFIKGAIYNNLNSFIKKSLMY